MTTPRAGYSAISSYSRVEILALVQARPERTIAELTAATRLHANTVREHLQRLSEAGYVIQTTEHRTTRGRPRVLYSAATGDDDASSPIARQKVLDAAERGDMMRRVMPWTNAGAESIGEPAMHQIDAIVENLVDAGFDPIVDETALTIDLSPCPHATSQAGHRQTLCDVHLGLMRAVLAEAGGPLQATCIRSSDRPTDCIVELARV